MKRNPNSVSLVKIRAMIVCMCVLFIAGCVRPPERPSPPAVERPPEFPEDFYKVAAAKGEPVFVIAPSESQSVLVRVYREGPLAMFGHDHVVSSREVHGYARIPPDRSQARTDLYLPVESLVVDDPNLRKGAGFTTEISREDIDATRRRMLDEIMESAQHPFVIIHAVCAADQPPCRALDARITLHGITRTITFPAELQASDNGLVVSGEFSVLQSDFGMTPFSTLGGALRVRDRIDLHFRLEALRTVNE